MNIITTNKLDVTPKELARVLRESSPEDFAMVWYELGQLINGAHWTVKAEAISFLDSVGNEMVNGGYSACVDPLTELYNSVKYHSEVKQRGNK